MFMCPAKLIASETSAVESRPRYFGSVPLKWSSRNHGPTLSLSIQIFMAA
jgi:hypothetical protein